MENAQERRWQEIAEQCAGITDASGKPIDPGIIETVIVLNALDFHTTMSCEGHLEWGTGAPW